MLKINSNKFNFSFFLSDRKKVKSLKDGAIKNGGATQLKEGIYSNIAGSEFIDINSHENIISILVPSTLNTDKQINNIKYVKKYQNVLLKFYSVENMSVYNTMGSWYSDNLKTVVYDKITVISVNIKALTINDISVFNVLAEQIKKEMKQEGVSILINDSLAIV